MNPTTIPRRVAGRRGLSLAASALLSLGAVACSSESGTATVTPTETAIVTSTGTVSGSTAGTATEEVASADVVETIDTTTPAVTTPDSVSGTIEAGDVVTVDTSGVAGVALTDDEVAGLLWMREEEQLAHDVYAALGEMWGVRIFENIMSSERSHVDAALGVLGYYGIDDPAAGNELGTFTDPQIQALYDQFVSDGRASLVAALEVGALIEELDIADLRARSSATDADALATLYANLEKGSRNHLRAFTSQLESRDVVYEPTRLDLDDYEAIVSSPTERGHDA